MWAISKRCKNCGKMKKHSKGARVCRGCREDEIKLASYRQLSPVLKPRSWKDLWLFRRPVVWPMTNPVTNKTEPQVLLSFHDGSADLYIKRHDGRIERVL